MLSCTHQAEALTDDNLKVGKQASTLIASAPGNCSYQRSHPLIRGIWRRVWHCLWIKNNLKFLVIGPGTGNYVGLHYPKSEVISEMDFRALS
jgi:hypothetical protein